MHSRTDGPTLPDGASPKVFEEQAATEISVLVVDDDPDLRDLTATFLERERDEFAVATAGSAEDALEAVSEGAFDAIVSDYDMPRTDGLELLAAVRAEDEDLPFILFTGKGSEEIASEAISKGVTDYLQKKTGASQYSILANRLCNAVEKHRASKALKRSEQKFSKIVTNSTDVITIVNENGQFEYVSPAAEHVLGYSQEQLIGEIAFDYMPPADRQDAMEEFFAALEDPAREPEIEFRFERPDGTWTVVGARGKNLFDDEMINGFVVNGRDITSLKRQQRELESQNERLRNMREVLSHDLQNPLGTATGALELYRDTGEETYLEKVEGGLQRMDVLLDQILTLADNEMDVDDVEQVSLREVVRSAWELVETETAELHVEDSKELEADPVRLQHALENLIENAIEHTSGDVTIRTGTTESTIYVEDTGFGIPEADRDHVFESGYTTKEGNTGYGLNIVKQIVLGHGWDVEIDEGDDGGARFEITGVTFKPTVYN